METEEFQELLASDTKLIAELYVSQKWWFLREFPNILITSFFFK